MSPQKNDRKYAIAAVAIRLFSERGYDAVTAEDIASEAGIGVRTFFRYFATKEQAAFPDHEERVERFRAALEARRGAADIVAAAIEVGVANAQEYFEQPDLYRLRYQLVHNEPALRDHERIADRTYELAVEEFLAKELQGHPQINLVAPIVAATLVAGVNAVLDTWALDETADSRTLLAATKDIVRRSAHAALAATDTAATTEISSRGPDRGLVLVSSDDPELRRQIAELVERYGPLR